MPKSWGGKRHGEGNPFHGRKHTEEFKEALRQRNLKWTPEKIEEVRRWYAMHEGQPLHLKALAMRLGLAHTTVCKKAKEMGLTRVAGRKLPGPRTACGVRSKAKYPTQAESRAAIGRAARERIQKNGHPKGATGLQHTPEHRAKMGEAARRFWQTATQEQKDAVIDKAQRTKLERYGAIGPTLMPGSNPYSRCRHGRREDLGGQFFRSRWEANYARYLNFLMERGTIQKWEYEADTFWFEKIRRGVRSYTPDFKVTDDQGRTYYVEVKGWMDAKSKTKIKRMAKYHPSVDLRVVGEKAYREIERLVGGAIQHWERAA